MNIHRLLSSEERETTLGYLLEHPSKEINMNELARLLKLSAGQIHKYVSILREMRLVRGNEFQDGPMTRALRAVWNLKRIEEAGLIRILRRRFPKANGIGIFGSWAGGTNLENADLDIWIKMDKEPEDMEVAKARKEIEIKMNIQIDLIVATPERLEHFKVKSEAFYFSLYNGRHLWGEAL